MNTEKFFKVYNEDEIIDVDIIEDSTGEFLKKENHRLASWNLTEAVLLMRYAVYFFNKHKFKIIYEGKPSPCRDSNTIKEIEDICNNADLLLLCKRMQYLSGDMEASRVAEEEYSRLELSVSMEYGITLLRIKDFFRQDTTMNSLTQRGLFSVRYKNLLKKYNC